MNRVTKRAGDRVYINTDIIPSACTQPSFCQKRTCVCAGEKDSCPYLVLLYRLAELEDKIESGELVEVADDKKKKQIEEVAKVVNRLAFDLRTNMTSITRYVRHERAKHPNLTEGQFIDRHLEYRKLANVAVDNILKCINDNEDLRRIECMRFDDLGYRKQSEDVTDINVGNKFEWISVEERLPKVALRVLITDGKKVAEGYVLNMGDSGLCPWVASQPVFHRDVTHWMPLPEAPKMKGGGE